MKINATVATTPSSDTGPGAAIVLHFDSKRYIFGHLPEGTQRAFIEHNTRSTKVGDLFISGRTEWQSNGGLVGLLLTMADVDAARGGSRDLVVHGGANLMYTLATTRSFVFRKEMRLKIQEFDEQLYFQDQNIKVKVLKIEPSGTLAEDEYYSTSEEGESSGNESPEKGRKRSYDQYVESSKSRLQTIVADMFNSSLNLDDMGEHLITGNTSPMKRTKSADKDDVADPIPRGPPRPEINEKPQPPWKFRKGWLPRTSTSHTALSYIINTHEQRGKFLPKVAKELGVKPGPDFSKLTQGESVTTASGRVVRPEEVMEGSREGTGIAVCDIPDPSYLTDFVSQAHWIDRQVVQRRSGCFFWILGPGVVSDPLFKDFVASLPKSKHVISSPDVCPDKIQFYGAARANTLLNHLDPVFYPKLYSSPTPLRDELPEGALPAMIGMEWQIEPAWDMKLKKVVAQFDAEAALNEPEVAEFLQCAKEAKEELAKFTPEVVPGSDVEIYPLGTGSALPSKYRNVSSTLVRVPGVGSILFDCGENTLGQLKRVFGPEGVVDVLKDIKAVYISHLHADHQLGTVSVLKARSTLLNGDEPTFVIGPEPYKTFLKEYSMVERFGRKQIVFISNEEFRYNKPWETSPAADKVMQLCYDVLSLEKIETAKAKHCMASYTTAWTFKNGFKFAYSGDTRPTEAFEIIGKDATVLLHEATFEDELLDQAVAKKHSTIGEALDVGRKMNAWSVVLTHFSQRYPKISVTSLLSAETEEHWEGRKRVIMASDCMRFKVGEIGRFWMLRDGLAWLFGKEKEEEGENGVGKS